jgi:hypothetical protein
MKMKKAKSGSNLGMKSVKSGYDNNPGVTRADIIVAAKKKAKGGAKMKKAMYGMDSTAMMEKGGKMKKAMKGTKMKTMKNGGTLSPSKSSTSTRLSTYGKTIGKNTMGKAKGGMKMKKCKTGC